MRGWGSQNQRRKAEFGQVQKVNTVAKAENIRSYEVLESCQDIEKGRGEMGGTRTVVMISPKSLMIIFVGCYDLLGGRPDLKAPTKGR